MTEEQVAAAVELAEAVYAYDRHIMRAADAKRMLDYAQDHLQFRAYKMEIDRLAQTEVWLPVYTRQREATERWAQVRPEVAL